jgi:hypothetical protein
MEEDNYIRTGENVFFYGPGSVRCKGQRDMATNYVPSGIKRISK